MRFKSAIVSVIVFLACVFALNFSYAKLPPTDPGTVEPAPPTSPPGDGGGGDGNCDYSQAGGFWNQNLCPAPGVPVVEHQVYKKPDFDSDTNGGGKQALSGIKTAINWVLGLLALIALIVLIYTGVMMLINARDSKKVEEGYGVVKNVAIALVFIGISWLIVSFIFWAIGVFTGP